MSHDNKMYHVVNLNNLLFSNTRTLEFRISNASHSFTKVANWLFICIAIVTFAEKYSKEIISRKLKPTLADVLDGYKTSFGWFNFEDSLGSEIAEYLKAYVNFRKDAIKVANKKQDWKALNIEFGEIDKNFKFSNGVIDNIY